MKGLQRQGVGSIEAVRLLVMMGGFRFLVVVTLPGGETLRGMHIWHTVVYGVDDGQRLLRTRGVTVGSTGQWSVSWCTAARLHPAQGISKLH